MPNKNVFRDMAAALRHVVYSSCVIVLLTKSTTTLRHDKLSMLAETARNNDNTPLHADPLFRRGSA
jgi:hypothetical protein